MDGARIRSRDGHLPNGRQRRRHLRRRRIQTRMGTESLYLATVGLIPTRPAVDPRLTGAALAIRTADRVLTS